MGLLCLSVRSRRSGLASLDKLSDRKAQDLLRRTLRHHPTTAGVALRTCNRFELYFSMPDGVEPAVRRFIGSFRLDPHQELYAGVRVVEHLFEVSAGLDSELIGEDEIQGQVRSAYQTATNAGFTDRALSELFERAIHVGKRVRNETHLHDGVTSLARLAIEQARREHPDLTRTRIGVLGAGQMGGKILSRLLRDGARNVTVAARSERRRTELRSQGGFEAVTPGELARNLKRFDVVFCAAETQRPLLLISPETTRGRDTALTVVDLGVPPNLGVRGHPHQFSRFTMEDLRRESHRISLGKAGSIQSARRIVREESREFARVQEERDIARFAERLLAQAEMVAREEREKALSLLGSPPEVETVIRNLSTSLIKRLLLPSIVSLRSLSPEERTKAIAVAERLLIVPTPA